MELKELYEQNMYPSLDKFWKIIQQKTINVSYDEVKNFINQQPITQIFKVKRKKQGHITAFNSKERVQIDIIIMDKFFHSNRGFKYIFVLIDVFTRKGYAFPMKTKTIQETSAIMEDFCERYFIPEIVNCDNDSAFLGRDFQNIMKQYNILFVPNDLENHKHLGVVDTFIRTIKNTIYKHFKYRNTINWIDILPNIIRNYNSTPNQSIGNIRPENAHLKENQQQILLLNVNKSRENINEEVFKVGDRVRKRVKTEIKNRSYNPNFSSEIYTIVSIEGNKYFLGGLIKPVYKHDMLLVPDGTLDDMTENELQRAIKADKIRRQFAKEGIEVKNVIFTKRNK